MDIPDANLHKLSQQKDYAFKWKCTESLPFPKNKPSDL